MNTFEAIKTRRSIRAYTPETVSDEDLLEIVRAGAAAASGGNAQPWAFIIARKQETLQAIKMVSPGIIGQPQAVVAICMEESLKQNKDGAAFQGMVLFDIGAAMQNMLLAAHELDLGACAIGSFHVEAATRVLGIPEGLRLVLMITIGRSKIVPKSPKKKPLEEICYFETYGNRLE